MYIYELDALKQEVVTPKHSTAFGRLITSSQVELDVPTYKVGQAGGEFRHAPRWQLALAERPAGKALRALAWSAWTKRMPRS